MRNKLNHFLRDFNQWSLFTMIIVFLIAIPLLSILVYLRVGVGEMWQHIVKHFLFDYIKNSVILLACTGLLTSFFGISSAYIIANYQLPFRKLLQWLLFLPLAIPSYIVAYAYVGLFDNNGTIIRILNSIGISIQKIDMMNINGLVWILSCSLFPYVYASSLAMFKSFPKSVEETSQLFGISSTKYLFSVALPLASPAIIGGLFLVFMEVLNDYGAAKYYGINTFTTGIFRTWTMLEDLQSAVYLSAILVLIVLSLNYIVQWQRRKKSYVMLSNSTQKKKVLKPLLPPQKIIALIILLIPILFGFLLPIGQLIYWALITFKHMLTMDLFSIALQSFAVALITALVLVITSLALIFFGKWNPLKNINQFQKLATIGYVIPGAIIGIGIIRSSQTIIDFFDDVFHLKIGWLFYGSSVILIYAYIFRFLAVAFNPISTNSLKLSKTMAEASSLLGANKLKTLFSVEFPLLKQTIISAFLLIFIDTLKELPLTLILKPYKLQTLAVKAFEYADDERVADAALPALILVSLIIILMIIVHYLTQVKNEDNE